MKLLVLNYEYPPLGGGAGVISRHIAEGLRARGHEVWVLTTWYEGETEMSLPGETSPGVYRLRSRRKHTFRSGPPEMLDWMKACRRFLNKHLTEQRYDLIFAHFTLPGGGVAEYIRQSYGIPYVIMSHGHDIPWFFPRQMFFYHLLTYFRIRKICHSASAVFVQSPDMFRNAARFLGRGKAGRIHLIHNGAGLGLFFPDQALRDPGFTILFSGRLVKQKGPMLFLKAIRLLKEKSISFRVIVSGDGPLKRVMEKFVIRHNLSAYFVFTGWIPREEMAVLYRKAHIMVAPSLNEGMSMALNEALASGLYTFTTPVSCNENLIVEGVNGEIVATRDSSGLAKRLENYYHEKFLKNYTIPAEHVLHFKKAYAWEGIVEEYESVLQKIIQFR